MGHGFESCAVNQYDRCPTCSDKVYVFVPAYCILLTGACKRHCVGLPCVAGDPSTGVIYQFARYSYLAY